MPSVTVVLEDKDWGKVHLRFDGNGNGWCRLYDPVTDKLNTTVDRIDFRGIPGTALATMAVAKMMGRTVRVDVDYGGGDAANYQSLAVM